MNTKIIKIRIVNDNYDYDEKIKNDPNYNKWKDPEYRKKYFREYHRKDADIIEPFERLTPEQVKENLYKIKNSWRKIMYHCSICNKDITNGKKYYHNKSKKHLQNSI